MARGTGPRRALSCLGYVGWSPETTGARGVAPADERPAFDVDPTQEWIEAMARRLLGLQRNGAPGQHEHYRRRA
jgi:putative AlgH/UPF0301 family transcriptional regulator